VNTPEPIKRPPAQRKPKSGNGTVDHGNLLSLALAAALFAFALLHGVAGAQTNDPHQESLWEGFRQHCFGRTVWRRPQ
jgi:hypothetical protein